MRQQESVCQWADATFGSCTLGGAHRRFLDEVHELNREMLYLYENLNRRATDIEGLERATDECADVLITLYRLVRCLTSTPLEDLVEQKMIINRARQWKSNGDGTGKHIRVTPDELATANKVWRTITEAL